MPPPNGKPVPGRGAARHRRGRGQDRGPTDAVCALRTAHCRGPVLASRTRAPAATTVKAHGAAEDVCAGPRPGEGHRRPFFGGRTGRTRHPACRQLSPRHPAGLCPGGGRIRRALRWGPWSSVTSGLDREPGSTVRATAGIPVHGRDPRRGSTVAAPASPARRGGASADSGVDGPGRTPVGEASDREARVGRLSRSPL